MIEKGQLRQWGPRGPTFMVMNRVEARLPRGSWGTWWILQDGAVYHKDARYIMSFSIPCNDDGGVV